MSVDWRWLGIAAFVTAQATIALLSILVRWSGGSLDPWGWSMFS